jgi:HAD superfamily hydrolase (TIGR01509 family)
MNSVPQNARALLFDLDGTLVDSVRTIARHFIRALDETGVRHSLTASELVRSLETPFEELNRRYSLGMNESDFERFVSRYRANYHADPIGETRVFPGVPETLESLRKKNFLLVLATGKHMQNALKIVRALSLEKYFGLIQGWEEDLRPKPEPDILCRAARRAGVPAERCCYIGDTPVDVRAGKSFGGTTVAALYGFGRKNSLLESQPDILLERFTDLPRLLENLP